MDCVTFLKPQAVAVATAFRSQLLVASTPSHRIWDVYETQAGPLSAPMCSPIKGGRAAPARSPWAPSFGEVPSCEHSPGGSRRISLRIRALENAAISVERNDSADTLHRLQKRTHWSLRAKYDPLSQWLNFSLTDGQLAAILLEMTVLPWSCAPNGNRVSG